MVLSEQDYIKIFEAIVIPVIIGLMAIFWSDLQSWHRRRKFTNLILRELEEFSPFPENKQDQKNWRDHSNKRFIHKDIFQDPSHNRDFILSLDPQLVYYVNNLWDSFEKSDHDQFMYYLNQIYSKHNRKKIDNNYHKWEELIQKYEKVLTDKIKHQHD